VREIGENIRERHGSVNGARPDRGAVRALFSHRS
jgi:hypothetical protein